MVHVMRIFLLFFVTIFLFSCEGCDDNSKPKTELEKLPPMTQSGKNTFGCLVNGKAWVTRTSIDALAFYQEGVLSISAGVLNEDWDQGLGILIQDIDLHLSEYLLDNPILRFAELGDKTLNCVFRTNADTYTGSFVINHLDQEKLIVSGTFEFDAYSIDCNELVKVTNGRFDLTYAD